MTIDKTFGIPSFTDFKQCKEAVRSFVLDNRNPQGVSSFAAVLDSKMLFTIASTASEDEVQFLISTFAEGRKPISAKFSDIEFADGDGEVNWDELIRSMWVEIVGSMDPTKEYSAEQLAAMGV